MDMNWIRNREPTNWLILDRDDEGFLSIIQRQDHHFRRSPIWQDQNHQNRYFRSSPILQHRNHQNYHFRSSPVWQHRNHHFRSSPVWQHRNHQNHHFRSSPIWRHRNHQNHHWHRNHQNRHFRSSPMPIWQHRNHQNHHWHRNHQNYHFRSSPIWQHRNHQNHLFRNSPIWQHRNHQNHNFRSSQIWQNGNHQNHQFRRLPTGQRRNRHFRRSRYSSEILQPPTLGYDQFGFLDSPPHPLWEEWTAAAVGVIQERDTDGFSPQTLSALPAITFKKQAGDGDINAEKCTVCLEIYDDGERVVQLPCSHIFHGYCVADWFGIRRTCPLCRRVVVI